MKPILFNTEMVRAILDDRKTVTRRVIKYKHSADPTKTLDDFIGTSDPQLLVSCAPYKAGDVLWVREAWQMVSDPEWQVDNKPCSELITNWKSITKIETYNNGHEGKGYYVFKADNIEYNTNDSLNWRPSIYMPKEAARLFLRVTSVQVERLQDMNLDDFLKEGVGLLPEAFNDPDNAFSQARSRFYNVWNSTIKKPDFDCYGWHVNPWVWVIEFERIDKATAKGGLNFEQM